MSIFGEVPKALPVSIFQLSLEFVNDPRYEKVNLGISAYRTEEGLPWVLPVVRAIEAVMAADSTLNHEYLPILGLPSFRDAAVRLALGRTSSALVENRTAGVQTISGTGALRLAADFLFNNFFSENTQVLVSNPTWPNHFSIFRSAGFSNISTYSYWNGKSREIDFPSLIDDLNNAPNNSIVVLQSGCHNPTGMDPSQEQWKQIASVVIEKGHFCVFDSAFQGLASGDVEEDAWPIRYFVSLGLELLICQSFSKNFGLYNERVGNLILVTKNAKIMSNCKSQLEELIRQNYSNPPNHGARIVATALNNTSYYQEWTGNVKIMAKRMKRMRTELYEKLRLLGTPGSWKHIIQQNGMFSFTGLGEKHCEWLRENKALYMMKNGRINTAALNSSNIDYVAKSIDEVVRIIS